MRIVAGEHRGRALKAPKGDATRPTSDRAREAIFNVLAHGLDIENPILGSKVLDVFAGAGALGLEALSRGAEGVTFIERGADAARVIQANIATLKAFKTTTILKLDATHLPPPARTAHAPATLVFLDPPYEQDLMLPALLGLAQKGWLADGAALVCETGAKEEIVFPPKFEVLDQRDYGAAKVTFLKYKA